MNRIEQLLCWLTSDYDVLLKDKDLWKNPQWRTEVKEECLDLIHELDLIEGDDKDD